MKLKTKILIVYFSLGGRTKRIAEKIALDLNSSDVSIERLRAKILSSLIRAEAYREKPLKKWNLKLKRGREKL